MDAAMLQLIGIGAGVISALAFILTFIFGVYQFTRSARSQLQSTAFGVLQHYLDHAVARPDLATRAADQPVDLQYGWFAAEAMVTAQTLWQLVGKQPDWRRTIDAIIRNHVTYLRSGAFVCDDFAPEFVTYLRRRVPDLNCAATASASIFPNETPSMTIAEKEGNIR
ncbi:MAG: hypothetical protein IT338_00640 [Thermomicrobiales bacterium]|nr:hypothetical protein [Thermomicrobiales bacterium]